MNYWAVGAAHEGTEDLSKDFLDKGIWYDGYAYSDDDRNKNILDEVAVGDLILMKSSSTKGTNHSITFTKLKGIGKVIGKDDYYYFRVKWYELDELPLDFDGISYRKTIEHLRNDEMMEFAKNIINKENIKMNYWHIQLHPNDRETISKDVVIKILKEKSVIGVGEWEEGQGTIEDFKNRMKIGDIVAVREGTTPIALVKVKGDYRHEEDIDDEFDWFEHRKDVEVLDYYKSSYDFKIPQAMGTLSICTNLSSETSKTIIKWYEKYMENNNANKLEDKCISLFKYKNQIILQGPPGTGKTRAAKLIAEKLIKPRTIGNPESIIDDLVKKFNPNDEIIKSSRESRKELLSKFYRLFPKEDLDKLTLESYCTGRGDRDNLCWWIETGLKPLGSYSPGSSRSYQIYWSKDKDVYSKHGSVKDIEDINEAMKKLAESIFNVVNTKKTDNPNGFLLKLLNTYYPDEYFPINSENMINNALKIFKVDFKGLNVFEKNQKLNEIYNEKKKQLNSDINSFEFGRLLWEKFNLKTGENINDKNEAVASGEYEIIQFHPAYSYEDFVRGIVAETDESGNVSYQVKNKILADFAQKATDNPNGNYVLIIDEINRANLPSVLGELIYALEYRGEAVTSMYEYDGEREITLPKNLFIIGTMNTADRSVGHIDYAIRRRFAFVDILPDESVIKYENAKTLFNEIKKLFGKDFLSPDFKEKDVMIGHSYFLVENEEELNTKLEYEIKPILREYLKDGIFLDNAGEKIKSLHV